MQRWCCLLCATAPAGGARTNTHISSSFWLQVLALAESLQVTTTQFDALRIQRYRQKALDEARRWAPTVAPGGEVSRLDGLEAGLHGRTGNMACLPLQSPRPGSEQRMVLSMPCLLLRVPSGWPSTAAAASTASSPVGAGNFTGSSKQQQVMESENKHLVVGYTDHHQSVNQQQHTFRTPHTYLIPIS